MGRKSFKGWLYLLPAILFLAFFMVYPLIDVLIYSVEEGYNSASQSFFSYGTYNFSYVLHDPYFLQALKNTFILVIITVPLSTGTALLISLGLNSIKKLRELYLRCGEDAIELLKGMEVSSIGGGWNQRLRLVPFSSVGKRYGMLPGFRADRVLVTEGRQHHAVQAVICIGGAGFCGRQDYKGVLNPELLAATEPIGEVSA